MTAPVMTSVPRSGKMGVINGITGVRKWSLNDTQDTKAYAGSNTQSGHGRVNGVGSWSGSFDAYGGLPLILPGQLFTFSGYCAPTSGVAGSAGTLYGGPAIVDSITLSWNWESGDIIAHTVAFSGNGALTPSLGTLSDVAAPDVPTVCGTKAYIVTVDGDEEWLNIKMATLVITAANQNKINSSTACWTGKEPGLIDFTLALQEQNIPRGSAVNMPQKGDSVDLKLTLPGGTFWRFQWAKIKEFTGINVDVEAGTIVDRTCNLEMNGFNAGSVGQIILPGGTVFWPTPA